jgi:hypothetical protein
VGAEGKGHVPDAFAVRHGLCVQRDVHNGLVVVVIDDAALRVA